MAGTDVIRTAERAVRADATARRHRGGGFAGGGGAGAGTPLVGRDREAAAVGQLVLGEGARLAARITMARVTHRGEA